MEVVREFSIIGPMMLNAFETRRILAKRNVYVSGFEEKALGKRKLDNSGGDIFPLTNSINLYHLSMTRSRHISSKDCGMV